MWRIYKEATGTLDERREPERPRQEKPVRARSQRIKPRNEKVPFNNPFVAVFGKK